MCTIVLPQRRLARLVVRSRSKSSTTGWLTCGTVRLICALGSGDRRALKREGDGVTPIGLWRLSAVFYRADRLCRPQTRLPVRALTRHDGWCDAPADRNYNRLVRHPYPASAEKLWRSDHLYDVLVVLEHNIRPRVRGGGSAIFLHVAGPGFAPTAGCVALRRDALIRLLRHLRPGDGLLITA